MINLSVKIVKEISESVAEPLTYINVCFKKGVITHNLLKTALVKAIYKKSGVDQKINLGPFRFFVIGITC